MGSRSGGNEPINALVSGTLRYVFDRHEMEAERLEPLRTPRPNTPACLAAGSQWGRLFYSGLGVTHDSILDEFQVPRRCRRSDHSGIVVGARECVSVDPKLITIAIDFGRPTSRERVLLNVCRR